MSNRFVFLFRAVNVGGRNRLPMATLRQCAKNIGATDVATYIQSGNLVLSSESNARELHQTLTKALRPEIDFEPSFQIISARDWQKAMRSHPWPDADDDSRKRQLLYATPERVSKKDSDQLKELIRSYGADDELFAVSNGWLWIDHGASIHKSKLTKARLEKTLQTTVTARNQRTVARINALI